MVGRFHQPDTWQHCQNQIRLYVLRCMEWAVAQLQSSGQGHYSVLLASCVTFRRGLVRMRIPTIQARTVT